MQTRREQALEERDHLRAIIIALRKRLRALELQQAQNGAATPPHIITEIASLLEQINQNEAKIFDLSFFIGDDEETILPELRYRRSLAYAWELSPNRARPSVAFLANLEVERRQLGISADRAQQIEHDIRSKLVEEVLFHLDSDYSSWLSLAFGIDKEISEVETRNEKEKRYLEEEREKLLKRRNTQMEEQLSYIGKAVRLDIFRTVEILGELIPKSHILNWSTFEEYLKHSSKTWIYSEDAAIFEAFISELKKEATKNN